MHVNKDIILRPIEKSDLEILRQMHNDWSTISNLTDTTLINEIQQEDWFISMCRSKSSLRLAVIKNDYGIIGCIRIDNIDYRNRSAQIGGDIIPIYRGMGFGNKMFSACLEYTFNILNVRRAYLSVLETNLIALSMYKKYGFKEEGRQIQAIYRFGKYHDYINMFLLEHDYRKNNDTSL